MTHEKLVRGVAFGLVTLGVGSLALAHNDDPKAQPTAPRYEGTGYRAARDGPLAPGGFPSEGVTLQAWLPIGDFGGDHDNANDCWGYVSPSGREYALLGLYAGTGIVEITDPGNPVIIETILGSGSLWGDVKVFVHPKEGAFAYKVTESDGIGIQVIDLNDVDDGQASVVNEINVGGDRSHNVVIDTVSGFLYRVGGSFTGMGIYDLNQDPVNPPLVGEWPDRYIHDAVVHTFTDGPYAGRQVAFTCGGDNGGWENTGLEILDVTNKANVFTIDRFIYGGAAYSHQVWLSQDQQYAYLDDELDETTFNTTTTMRIIDVSDLENPVEMPSFTNGNSSIDHNLYVRGDFIFCANYTSGLRVFDASDPVNPSEVGYFDVWPSSDAPEYSGLWSNYPFFPSGTVIGSDRQQGLWVWSVDVLQNDCVLDLDGSGSVDFGDVLIVLAAWGQSGGAEDVDGSGTVDFGDILLLLGEWGPCE